MFPMNIFFVFHMRILMGSGLTSLSGNMISSGTTDTLLNLYSNIQHIDISMQMSRPFNAPQASIKHDVQLVTTIRTPPRSEIEVTGISRSLPSGNWFLEGQSLSPYQSVIAPWEQPVIVHIGTKLAELEGS